MLIWFSSGVVAQSRPAPHKRLDKLSSRDPRPDKVLATVLCRRMRLFYRSFPREKKSSKSKKMLAVIQNRVF